MLRRSIYVKPMAAIKYNSDDIGNILLFEKLTNTKAIDYMQDEDSFYFLVDADSIGKAIGKNGTNIRKLKDLMRKNVKVFKYSTNIRVFVQNMLPESAKSIDVIEKGDKKLVRIETDPKVKAKIIGRCGKNIKVLKKFLERHFNIENVQLV